MNPPGLPGGVGHVVDVFVHLRALEEDEGALERFVIAGETAVAQALEHDVEVGVVGAGAAAVADAAVEGVIFIDGAGLGVIE